ncbi:replication initiation protein [Burkholderia phage BcepMigl]|uniref:Replication protein n=1 Tax=Burkholderia phage BcepMigl TaxID=2886899 RepID=I6XGC7_9CAUD|nr:replication initiation protein [Burkholderia phage BcepMigl]AFN39091.1 replication protein [Burkholderia phage BcepMigl]
MNHSFDIELAQRFGLHEAILIHNFQFWIAKNRANGRHLYDGHTWTYNSAKALAELLPYFSDRQIRRALDSLVEQGVLLKGNYNASTYDRTLWFAFDDEVSFLGGQMHSPNSANGGAESGDVHSPKNANGSAEFGDSSTDKKPDGNPDSKPDDLLFEEAWLLYPKRPNNSKAAALKAWNARIKAGVDPTRMIEGVKRYAAFCAANKTEPQYIKQASTFFGPDLHFDSDYTVSEPPPRGNGRPSSNSFDQSRPEEYDDFFDHRRGFDR